MRTQADRDDDLALGRELERKDAEIDRLRAALSNTKAALASIGYLNVTNLGSEKESGRPARYFECRLCTDWNDDVKHIEHADGCPLRS